MTITIDDGFSFEIVPFAPEHAAEAHEIEKAVFSDPWSRRALTESAANPDAAYCAAVLTGGECIGYAGMYLARGAEGSAGQASINNIAVAEPYRRAGVGGALLAALISRARREGADEVFLEARISNANAIAFYEKRGFTRIGVRRNFYARPREDAAVMALRI